MSQRPHLGSISSSPWEDYISCQTGHAATGEKKAEVQKIDLKPSPTSFNTLLFTPSTHPHPTSWYPEHSVLTSQMLEASPSRSLPVEARFIKKPPGYEYAF